MFELRTHKLRIKDLGEKGNHDWRVDHEVNDEFETNYECSSRAKAKSLKEQKEGFYKHHGHSVI